MLRASGTGPDWSSALCQVLQSAALFFCWSTPVNQDLLAAAFLLSFLLLCLRPAVSQAALAALWLGLSNNSAHNWFHLGDKQAWRRYRTRVLCTVLNTV